MLALRQLLSSLTKSASFWGTEQQGTSTTSQLEMHERVTQVAELTVLHTRKNGAYWSYTEKQKRGNVRGTKETLKLSPFPESGKSIKEEISDLKWT